MIAPFYPLKVDDVKLLRLLNDLRLFGLRRASADGLSLGVDAMGRET